MEGGMRRRWIAGLALLVAATGALWLGQRPLGEAIYTRMAETRAGADATDGLPDGLHLFLCGTGSPLPDPARAGPCAAVIAGNRFYVVDVGEGASRTLGRAQFPLAQLDGLFLTHFHSDHIDGLGPLMLLRWTQSSAREPLPVHAPGGVEAVIAGFAAAYATDNGYRVAHHGETIVPPSGAGARAIAFALPPEDGSPLVVLRDGDLTVSAFRVDHDPVSPAVGYRFDYKGRSIVISGDTSASSAVTRNARGADLLLHEALQPRLVAALTRGLEARGAAGTAKITRDILDYHATPEEAAASARDAGVGMLILTHIVPPLPSRAFHSAFLGDAPSRYSGPIVVGEDGLLFTLPAGSDAIEREDLL
jgi:ribonuclease Z